MLWVIATELLVLIALIVSLLWDLRALREGLIRAGRSKEEY